MLRSVVDFAPQRDAFKQPVLFSLVLQGIQQCLERCWSSTIFVEYICPKLLLYLALLDYEKQVGTLVSPGKDGVL